MNRKAALGLSIELLVVIIISLVILGAGIAFLYQIIGGAEDLKDQLDERTAQELERLLVDQGQQVALSRHAATLFPGESKVFGLGILNTRTEETFTITVELSKALDAEGTVRYDDENPDTSVKKMVRRWLLYNTAEFQLKENEHRAEAILVSLPNDAAKGTYIYDVIVLDSAGLQYGQRLKLTIRVD